jgi:hypothetical protein
LARSVLMTDLAIDQNRAVATPSACTSRRLPMRARVKDADRVAMSPLTSMRAPGHRELLVAPPDEQYSTNVAAMVVVVRITRDDHLPANFLLQVLIQSAVGHVAPLISLR